VEIAVVMMEALFVLDYSLGHKHRVYLLYTGQHYDPLVAAVVCPALSRWPSRVS
jgi:hypothetical protein